METDEKLCPFCAEVIKAAAVKCRYCHSDLPMDEAPEAPVLPDESETDAPEVEPEPEVDPEPEPEAEPEPAPQRPTLKAALTDKVVVGLSVLALLLIGGLVAIVLTSRPDDLRTADNEQVTATPYRDAAMTAASANVQTILSYAHGSLAKDEEAARKVLTAEYYEKDYQATIAQRRASITKSKLTQVATVLSTSLVSLTPDEATVMLLTNIINVPEGSKSAPPQVLSRLLVTMERKDGGWIVSEMNGF